MAKDNEELVDMFEIEDVEETREEGPAEVEDPKPEGEEQEEEPKGEEGVEEQEEDSEEDSEEEGSNEPEPLVLTLAQQLGYEPEEGEELEDSEEGLLKLVRNASKRQADEYIQSQLDETPIVKDWLAYVQAGGDPTKFLETTFPSNDYFKVQFDESNETQQEQLVRADLVARGYRGEELEAEIEDIKNGGILESKAKRALGSLKQRQQAEKANLVKQQQAEFAERQKEAKKFWDQTNQHIDNATNFKGLKIPESEKQPFKAFLQKPVKGGKTQRDVLLEQLDLDDSLAIDYMLFKKFDIASLVDKRAKQQRVQSLRERLSKPRLDKEQESPSSKATADDIAPIL